MVVSCAYLLKAVVFHDWIKEIQTTMFVGCEVFAGYTRHISVTRLVSAVAAAAIFCCVGAAIFCYITVSLFVCTHGFASLFFLAR